MLTLMGCADLLGDFSSGNEPTIGTAKKGGGQSPILQSKITEHLPRGK